MQRTQGKLCARLFTRTRVGVGLGNRRLLIDLAARVASHCMWMLKSSVIIRQFFLLKPPPKGFELPRVVRMLKPSVLLVNFSSS